MAKAKRKQKLKVYCTPIGFHNALVAAPSQKAALEAWGADSNLFAQGNAEVVDDPQLTKVPLEHPGQVVKVLRGTEAEQLAAVGKKASAKRAKSAKAPKAEIVPKKPKVRPRKPSRAALTRAEKAMERIEKRHAGEEKRLNEQLKALESKIRDSRRRHERERDKAQEKLENERSKYKTALDRYESG